MVDYKYFETEKEILEYWKKKKISKAIFIKIEKVLRFFDKFISNKVIYPNVYVVARKK